MEEDTTVEREKPAGGRRGRNRDWRAVALIAVACVAVIAIAGGLVLAFTRTEGAAGNGGTCRQGDCGVGAAGSNPGCSCDGDCAGDKAGACGVPAGRRGSGCAGSKPRPGTGCPGSGSNGTVSGQDCPCNP